MTLFKLNNTNNPGRCVLFMLVATLCHSPYCLAESVNKPNKPDVLLAQIYQPGTDVSHYLVSEKFDGVRAIWDGNILRSRAGNEIASPAWFTQNFPTVPMDGELWLSHGKFDELSGIVRKTLPIDAEWRKITYLVFELPGAADTFASRSASIKKIIDHANLPQLKAVDQKHVNDEAALQQLLKQIVANGGEGLMLHRADAPYVKGRSAVLLKLKPLFDAEATVIAHTPGRGKYSGKLGALVVETPDGIRFKIGTGFSDAQRANPPRIGTLITYTYRGMSEKGKPKFVSFLRVRNE